MAVVLQLDPGSPRCTITLSGMVSFSDLERTVLHLIAMRGWSRKTVVDTTEVTGVTLQLTDARALAAFLDDRTRDVPLRGAIAVVAPNPLVFELSRFYHATVSDVVPLTLCVVRSLEEADWWFAHPINSA